MQRIAPRIFQKSKDTNKLYVEFELPSETITEVTEKPVDFKFIIISEASEGSALGNGKKGRVSKVSMERTKIKLERFFIDISSPS